MNETSKKTSFPFLPILAGAFVLRILFIRQYALNMDEAWTVQISSLPPADIVRGVMGTPAMPLGYLLMHPWALVSTHPVWIQLLPILFSAACVWLTFVVASRLFDRRAGAVAALFAALSPSLVQYGHFVRYPIFLVFFSLASLSLTLDLAGISNSQKPPNRSSWLIVPILLAACVYLHYFAVFWVVGLNALFFLYSHRWPNIAKWAAGQLVPVVAFLIWIPYMGNLRDAAQPAPLGDALRQLLTVKKLFLPDIVIQLFTGVYIDIHRHSPAYIALKLCVYLFLLVFAVGALRGVFSKDAAARRAFRALSVLVAASLVAGLVATTVRSGPLFTAQYFLFVLPPLLLLVAAIATRDPNPVLRVFLISTGIVVFSASLAQTYGVYATRPNSADAVRRIGARMSPGDVILLRPAAVTSVVDLYAPRHPRVVAIPKPFDISHYRYEDVYVAFDKRRADSVIARLRGARRVWYLKVNTRFEFDPRGYVESWLTNNYRKREAMDFVESYPVRGTLTLYELKSDN